jgi:archaellum component FlaC
MNNTEESKQNGWNEYSKLVLNELERLNANYESLREDFEKMKNDFAKSNTDDVKSNFKEIKKEVDDLKLFKARATAVYALIQFFTAILIALKDKIFK